MSYKKTLIRALDRPGGRAILGRIATRVVQRGGGAGVEIVYAGGFWIRRVGSNFFPDSPKFDYTYADFHTWTHQLERYVADAQEYWLRYYSPQAGDIIVDVGAGRGEDTFAFSRAVGETGHVIAIEAHPLSFAILKKFCELNHLSNVTPLHVALMDKPGTVRITESDCSWTEHSVSPDGTSSEIEVRASTLDQICQELGLLRIAFLKMNIEGAERQALLGMATVFSSIQQICVACHDFRADQGHGEHLRTRKFVEQLLCDRGFAVVSRKTDPREWVRDHIFGLRHAEN